MVEAMECMNYQKEYTERENIMENVEGFVQLSNSKRERTEKPSNLDNTVK